MSNPCKLACIAVSLFVLNAVSPSVSSAADGAAAPKPVEAAPAPVQTQAVGATAPSPAVPAVDSKPLAPLTPLPELVKPAPAPVPRIGYVDIVRIGQDSAKGKAAQAQIKSRLEKLQTQVTARQKQLDKQKSSIQEKLPSLSPDQRAVKAKEFEKKVLEFQKFVQKGEKEMQSLQEGLTRKLADDVKAAAASYGKANGFISIVVNREILYQSSDVTMQDLTDELIKSLDAGGK